MQTKYPPRREPDPDPLVQRHPGSARPARARCSTPGRSKPVTPQDLLPLFPMAAHRAGGLGGALDQDPRRGPRGLPAVAPVAALPRARGSRRRSRRRPRSTTSTRASRRPGSHKPNTAVPQAYYNKIFGTKRIATETGAGQWGTSMAMAAQMFGLECTVYMVKVSFEQKPYRKSMMQLWGAKVIASPSNLHERRARRSSRRIRTARARSASPSPRRSRTRRPTRTRATRSARC